MKQLFEIVKKNRLWIAVYVFAGIVLSFLSNFLANYYQTLIDRFALGTLSLSVIVLYGVLMLVNCLLSYLDEYPGRKLEHGIYLDLKLKALEKISRIDYLAYQRLGVGKLLAQIESGSSAGRDMVVNFWCEVVRSLVPQMAFGMFFIFRQSRAIALSVLFGYAAVFLVTHLLLKTLYRFKEQILSGEETLSHFLTRGILQMPVFRLTRRFEKELAQAADARDQIVSGKIKTTLVHEAFFAIFAMLVTMLKIGILLYCWKTRQITIGSAIALMALVDNAYTPIAIFNVLFVGYKLNRASFARYGAFLEEKEDAQLECGDFAPTLSGDIRIESLTYSYGAHGIFSDFSLHIPKGQKVAFVGKSGCGKTTLLRLIAGFLKPQAGEILLDGKALSSLCLNDYYAHLSCITQESLIFDGTLRENLVFDRDVPDAQIEKVLQAVCLSDWYAALPDGLDTRLGARGASISGGEGQRLALARLWFAKNEILLLDEATSALDRHHEKIVLDRVLDLAKDHTVIAVAHRLSAVKSFDRICFFENGELCGDGTYDELMQNNPAFALLAKGQETTIEP